MIIFLDESSDNVLGVQINHKITHDEYERIDERLAEIAEAGGRVRLLLHLDNEFTMMGPAAFWQEFQTSLDHWDSVERLAVVGDERWHAAALGTLDTDTAALATHHFSEPAIDEAWRWLRTA